MLKTQKHLAMNSAKNQSTHILVTTGDESDDSETSDIDFVIQNLNRQFIVRTDEYKYLLCTSVSKMSEAQLAPAQTFKMVLYVEKVNFNFKLLNLKLLNFLAKNSILNV